MATASHSPPPTPVVPLAAIGALVLFSLIAVGTARLLDLPTTDAAPAVVVERTLLFEDRAGGRVAVVDAGTGETVRLIEPGEDGFMRATVRGLAQQRLRDGAETGSAFVLSGRADGRVFLDDPGTGRRIDLTAFGHTNARAFAGLLPGRVVTP